MSDDTRDDYDLADDAPEPAKPARRPAAAPAGTGGGPRTLGYARPGTAVPLDNAGRARRASLMLKVYAWAYAALSLLGLGIGVLLLTETLLPDLEDPNASFGPLIVVGIIVFVLGLAGFVLFVLAVVFYMMWQARAFHNANAAGRPTTHSPGWSVGWWFIPIANLFKPKAVLADLWSASGASRSNRDADLAVRAYQTFILSIVTGVVSSVLENVAEYAGDDATGLVLAWVIAGVVSSVLWFLFFLTLARYVDAVQANDLAGG